MNNSLSRGSFRTDDCTTNGRNGITKSQDYDVLSLQMSQAVRANTGKRDQLLHEAVIKNEHERVCAYLQSGVPINSTIHLDRTPLHWASMHGHVEIIRTLMQYKADIEAEDKLGMTPLLVASWYGHVQAVQLLIEIGANVFAVDKKGQTLLHCACRNDHLDVVTWLLESEAGRAQVNQLDKSNQSPLHLAVLNDAPDTVRLLLDAEAIPAIKDKNNERNALHWAAVKGYDEVLEQLLQLDPIFMPRNEPEAQGLSALHLAAEFGHRRCVRLLLRHEVDAFVEDDKGRTALHIAASLGYSAVVAQLAGHHARLVGVTDRKGNTALHLAVMGNHQQTVQSLIQSGAPINARNSREQTALHIACELGFVESAEVLLTNGADLSLCERSGRSALYVAARGSFPALVDLLIQAARLRQRRTGSVCSLACSTSPHSRKCSLERHTSLDSTDTHRTYLPTDSEDAALSRQASALSRQPSEQSAGTDPFEMAPACGLTVSSIPTLVQHQSLNQSKQMRDMLASVARQYLEQDDWKKLAKHWAFSDEQVRAIEHQYTGRSSFKEHGHRLLLIWLSSLSPQKNALKELLAALRCIQRGDVADRVRRRLAEYRTGELSSLSAEAVEAEVQACEHGTTNSSATGGSRFAHLGDLGDALKISRAFDHLIASFVHVRRRRRCDCLPADTEACGYCSIS